MKLDRDTLLAIESSLLNAGLRRALYADAEAKRLGVDLETMQMIFDRMLRHGQFYVSGRSAMRPNGAMYPPLRTFHPRHLVEEAITASDVEVRRPVAKKKRNHAPWRWLAPQAELTRSRNVALASPNPPRLRRIAVPRTPDQPLTASDFPALPPQQETMVSTE